MRYGGEESADSGRAARERAWVIADELARAGVGEVQLIGIAAGYRVELRMRGPAPDPLGVLKALALGDRWGHRHTSRPRDGGQVRDVVWSEVHLGATPGAPVQGAT
ncbi:MULTISPECIES: hypothetical protein [Kitasatospora]|uniref:Uncharacterized protein n=1 Tax=Kitasatospora setae (strain ATCC 33774 / DSM 43861 / JCM 3304 / KCC A-0304 / NBRC 14216 / KM-6054) TaxID=452652 RepID=E4N912_KITSK|nr:MULTISPECIES: hypothetical protein [Kitasatospora]BAJ27693.1 hypothetical protein KSE_18680 [Kitasatospora setae KM-6054]